MNNNTITSTSNDSSSSSICAPPATVQQIPAPNTVVSSPAIDTTTKISTTSSATNPSTTATNTATTKAVVSIATVATANTSATKADDTTKTTAAPAPAASNAVTTKAINVITTAVATNNAAPKAVDSIITVVTNNIVTPKPVDNNKIEVAVSSAAPSKAIDAITTVAATTTNTAKTITTTPLQSGLATAPSLTSTTSDSAKATTKTPRKRKPRSTSNDSSSTTTTTTTSTTTTTTTSKPPAKARATSSSRAAPASKATPAVPLAPTTQASSVLAAPGIAPPANAAAPTPSPPKRSRKKKTDQVKPNNTTGNATVLSTQASSLPAQLPVPQFRQLPGLSSLDIQHQNTQDPAGRYLYYSNYDYTNAASLTRPSLSRLFTSSAGPDLTLPAMPGETTATTGHQNYHHQQQQNHHPHHHHNQHSDELSNAFEDLRDNTWSHLSRCILEQAQQFDVPSLIGTLYTLRSENEKLVNKVRDLTMKRDQLLGINARLDLPGPMLTQHLSHTSPNFSSVVAGLTNSPKSLPNSSPSPAMNKSPLVPVGSYVNHITPHGPPPPHGGSSLGPPSFIDRSSPLVAVGAPHPAVGVSSLKSSTISTPSPPTGAMLAHGANNRASLMTVNNYPYLSAPHPSMNTLNQMGANPTSSSYYPRQ